MEDYSNHLEENNSKNSSGHNNNRSSSFLYGSNSSHPGMSRGFHNLPLASNDVGESNRFHNPVVKMEAGSNNSARHKFRYNNYYQDNIDHQSSNEAVAAEAIKAKIIAHPQYSSLLQAYMDCQKVYILCVCVCVYASIIQSLNPNSDIVLSYNCIEFSTCDF